jgi:hypothetical protein
MAAAALSNALSPRIDTSDGRRGPVERVQSRVDGSDSTPHSRALDRKTQFELQCQSVRRVSDRNGRTFLDAYFVAVRFMTSLLDDSRLPSLRAEPETDVSPTQVIEMSEEFRARRLIERH